MKTPCETSRHGATRLFIPVIEYSFETYTVGVKPGFRCLADPMCSPFAPLRWRRVEGIQQVLLPLLAFLKPLGSTVAAAKTLVQSRCYCPVPPRLAAADSTVITPEWKSAVSENRETLAS